MSSNAIGPSHRRHGFRHLLTVLSVLIAPMAPAADIDLAAPHGRVTVVEHFADYKVKIVQHFPDLKVQWVGHFPDAPGQWQRVDHFPDLTVQFVEHFPDFTIQLVEHLPGVP